LLRDLTPADLGALDPDLGEWLNRPLGAELLAGALLPASGTVYLSLLNFEPAGLIVLERGQIAAHVRALAVAPDLRRRAIARSMLHQIAPIVAERGLHWLWMSIEPDNETATRCALKAGFRRFHPQVLRRTRPGVLHLPHTPARAERIDEATALIEVQRWIGIESEAGDAWCAELAQADLLKWLAPPGGAYALCIVGEREVGLAHIEGDPESPLLSLWLLPELWGTPAEMAVLKAVIDLIETPPVTLTVLPGSGGHMQAAVALYKQHAFVPEMRDRVRLIRSVQAGG
jgi:GNAT superfamily N-acetyltransferase